MSISTTGTRRRDRPNRSMRRKIQIGPSQPKLSAISRKLFNLDIFVVKPQTVIWASSTACTTVWRPTRYSNKCLPVIGRVGFHLTCCLDLNGLGQTCAPEFHFVPAFKLPYLDNQTSNFAHLCRGDKLRPCRTRWYPRNQAKLQIGQNRDWGGPNWFGSRSTNSGSPIFANVDFIHRNT